MKSVLFMTLLLIALGSGTCWATNYDTTHNLVTNSGAEQNWLGDWSTAQNFSVSSSDAASGTYCFEAAASGTRTLGHSLIPIIGGAKFQFGLSYKSITGDPDGGSVAQVRFYNASQTYLGVSQQISLTPTAGVWTAYSLEMTAPANAAYADIYIVVTVSSVARVDDVSLYPENQFDLTRNLVQNGDAELGTFDNYSYIPKMTIDNTISAGPGTHAFKTVTASGELIHYSIGADVNEVMVLSFNYRTPAGDTTPGSAVALRYFDSRNNLLIDTSYSTVQSMLMLSPTNGTWQKYSMVFKVPSGVYWDLVTVIPGNRFDIYFLTKSAGTLIDDISVYRKKIAFDTRTNLATNGTFESPITSSNNGFVRNYTTSSLDNTTPGGTSCMSGSVYPLEYVVLYRPASKGEKYRLVFNYKTLPGATTADNSSRAFFRQFIVAPGGATSEFLSQDYISLPLTGGQWQQFSQDFVVGAETNGYDIYFDATSPMTGTVRIDDIAVYRVMESTDMNDLRGFSQEWLQGEGSHLSNVWSGTNAFIPDTNQVGAAFSMHFISTVWNSGTLYTYYILNDTVAGTSNVGLATTTDGVNFTDKGQVLGVGASGQWDSKRASFPGVWKDGSTWYMVYEGCVSGGPAAIGLATSSDGLTWTKSPSNPILQKSGSGFMSFEIGTPSLWKEGSTWYLFYHGFNLTDCQIGVATGTDILHLTHYSTTVPRVPTSTSGWDSGTAGKRSIFKEGSYYYMAYEGSTDQPYTTANWSTGLARSTDLLNWTKFSGNPILPQTVGGMGNDGPELATINDAIYLYVRPFGGGGTNRHRINCVTPLPWDSSGDCFVNFKDFADFAYRWLADL